MNNLDFRAVARDIRSKLEQEDQVGLVEHWQLLVNKLAYTNPQLLVGEFHQVMGLKIKDEIPDWGDYETNQLRYELIKEEIKELLEAWQEIDTVEVFDALADLVYVIYGACISTGVSMPALLAEVHRSNMTKLQKDGSVRKRKDGKILKPNTFQQPRVGDVVFRENGLGTLIDYKEPFER